MSIPAMAILYYVLQKWLPVPAALAVSVAIVLLIFSLFEPHDFGYKESIIVSLLIGLAVFLIATLIRC